MESLLVERLTSAEQLLCIEQEWRALERHLPPLPFVSFDWVAAWWQCLRSDRTMVRDNLHFLVFRDSSGALCGVAPLMLTHRPGSGPLRISQLQFIGADANVTELRCLIAPGHSIEVLYHALIDYLRDQKIACDWIKLTGITSLKLVERIKHEFGVLLWSREVPNFVLHLKPTWEEFKRGLPRNIKESLRKCYNAPKRDSVVLKFGVISSDGPELDQAVADLLRLHATRAQMTHTVAHPNVFRSIESKQFLFEVCRRFAQQDRVRVFQLRDGDKLVATRIGLLCGDSLYLYYSGYDPSYAQYSVMTSVVAEAIQYAIATGLRTVNLSIGRDVSKERWKPDEITYYEVEVAARSSLSAFKYHLFKATSVGLRQSWLGKFISRNEA